MTQFASNKPQGLKFRLTQPDRSEVSLCPDIFRHPFVNYLKDLGREKDRKNYGIRKALNVRKGSE